MRNLRWCPECGQVEIDETGLVLRKGDDKCPNPVEVWQRGSLSEGNQYFCSRFAPITAGENTYRQTIPKSG